MHAIIRLGQGKFYTSAIFGRYQDANGEYYIVYDQTKTKLVKIHSINPDLLDRSLASRVIIFDDSNIGWKFEMGQKRHFGGLSFLPKNEALNLVKAGRMPGLPSTISTECQLADNAVKLPKWFYVTSEREAERLKIISDGFHDAFVSECQKHTKTGDIRVLFAGLPGYRLELIFSGDAYCHLHDPEEDEPWWFDSKIEYSNGYAYLIDSAEANISQIFNWSTDCFRAQKLAYRIHIL